MKSALVFLALLPSFAHAGSVNVLDNVKALECRFLGSGLQYDTLKMTLTPFVDPRGVVHTQRKVQFTVGGVYFDDHYTYLLEGASYNEETKTYLLALHGQNTQDATLALQVEREDEPALKVVSSTLPGSGHHGYCFLNGEARN